MYKWEDIREVHLEVTTSCNASCPQCLRNMNGGRVNPNVPFAELSLENIKKLLSTEFLAQLSLIYMSGNYGDAIMAKDTLEIFRYFRRMAPGIRLKLYTNGSARNTEWWAELAKTIDMCIFAIDGLEDTNHLYRRGTSWRTIMRNVKAFILAGGRAEWAFLVFRHNEHQVDEARRLSESLGFHRFTVKRTDRFVRNGRHVDSCEVLDNSGNHLYSIEPPGDLSLRNTAAAALDEHTRTTNHSYESYLKTTPIKCKAVEQQMIFMSAEGLVFPCCWTGALYARPGAPSYGLQIRDLLNKLPGGKAAIDGCRHSIKEIVSGAFFQTFVPDAWQPGSNERLSVCAMTCGACDLKNSIKQTD